MKTTVSVNISGILFYLEEDAYEKLKNYILEISRRFEGYPEKKEILEDIEYRIAELFKERINERKQAITINDVYDVIRIIGQPSDIGGRDASYERKYNKDWGNYESKRLYRDVDGNVLGGVCSGLGYYFNMDAYILRIIFLVAFIVFGFGILLYILMWIIIPGAYSREQKREMKGEKYL